MDEKNYNAPEFEAKSEKASEIPDQDEVKAGEGGEISNVGEVKPEESAEITTEAADDKQSKLAMLFGNKKILVGAIALGAAIIIGVALLLILVVFRHQHVLEEIIAKEPTCTESGVRQQVCEECNEVLDSWEIPAQHAWGAAECGQEQACLNCSETRINPDTHSGYKKCRNCGKAEYNIKFPVTPKIVYYYNSNQTGVRQMISITSLGWDEDTNEIIWAAERGYHYLGDNYSAVATFAWRIVDSEGYVVDSGQAYSDGAIKVGEKVKNQRIPLYTSLHDYESWQDYTFEIINLK